MKRTILACLCLTLCAFGVPVSAVTYTITPTAYQTVLDASGNPVSGACVWTYTAGTSTPVTTYSDSGGTTNSNPIQADSAGRFVAYLAPGSSYKFVFEGACVPPAHGTTIRTVDNISAMGLGAVQANDIGNCEGRITLSSGSPVTTSNVTAATTVYFSPYKGNVCSTYDSTAGAWTLTSFAEVSLALGTDTTAKNYDLFGYSNAGTFTLERLVWTNDTTRATALTTQDGVYVKSGQTSRRYLGTYRTTGAGQTEDSLTKRFVWNYYNRVPRTIRIVEATDSWTYTTNTYRQANNSSANQAAVVVGVAESQMVLNLIAYAAHDVGAPDEFAVSIGEDSTTVPSTSATGQYGSIGVAVQIGVIPAALNIYPAVGYHFYPWLEKSITVGNQTTWYGDNAAGSQLQSGITGWIEG